MDLVDVHEHVEYAYVHGHVYEEKERYQLSGLDPSLGGHLTLMEQ